MMVARTAPSWSCYAWPASSLSLSSTLTLTLTVLLLLLPSTTMTVVGTPPARMVSAFQPMPQTRTSSCTRSSTTTSPAAAVSRPTTTATTKTVSFWRSLSMSPSGSDNDNDDDYDNNGNFFDDFEGQEIGGDISGDSDDDAFLYVEEGNNSFLGDLDLSGRGSISKDDDGLPVVDPVDELLQARIRSLEATEQQQRLELNENWKEGYWGVHAFPLDTLGIDDDDSNGASVDNDNSSPPIEESGRTFITCMTKISTNIDPDDDDDMEDHQEDVLLVVGRSDGSLIGLHLDPTAIDRSDGTETTSISALSNLENHFSLAGSWKPTSDSDIGSVRDMLFLPKSKSLWTIGGNAQSWIISHQFIIDQDTDQVPTSLFDDHSSATVLETPHTAPIISMKNIGTTSSDDTDMVVTVSSNGQIVIWNIHEDVSGQQSVATVVSQCHLFGEDTGEDGMLSPEERMGSNDDSILCADIVTDSKSDQSLLVLGSKIGKIYTLTIQYEDSDGVAAATPLTISFMSSWMAFSNGSNNGVSSIRLTEDGVSTTTKTPSKLLLAGNLQGEIKQWQLIASTDSSSSSSDTISSSTSTTQYQHWPRMSSQRMKDKAHVFDTIGRSRGSGAMFGTFADGSRDSREGEGSDGAIRSILYLEKQQVVIAATDLGDLTVYDPSTGQVLYSMDGSFDFRSSGFSQASLIAATPSILLTNGMGNYICVHDYAMERLDDDNIEDFFDVFSSE